MQSFKAHNDNSEKLTDNKVKNEDIIEKDIIQDNIIQKGKFNKKHKRYKLLIKSVELKYMIEGVCLKIKEYYGSDDEILSDLIEYLNNRQVENYDINTVKAIVEKKRMDLVRIAPSQDEICVDEKLTVDLYENDMKAYVELVPAYGGKKLTYEKALEKLESLVKYGIKKEVLEDIIANEKYGESVLVAEGKQPIDGEDGYIEYHFATTKNFTPDVLEDGSVDYRNLHIIENVKKGDVLCEIIPPTEGEDGMNLHAEVVAHKKGKEGVIKCGHNVFFSGNMDKIFSSEDGQVKVIDGKINVLDTFEVSGDVDNTTGNVKFNGTVVVKGNVKSGFVVNAYGDVIVEGVVEAARINSYGTITLKKGVQGGKKAYLTAKENIISKYIENCKMYCNGDIVANAIMHSDVSCDGSITVDQKKGLIVGGNSRAKGNIHAKIIGSEMETKTVIEVGVDPKTKERYKEVCDKLTKLSNNIEKLDKNIVLLNKLLKAGKLDAKKKNLLIESINARKTVNAGYSKLSMEQKELVTELTKLSDSAIYASKIIYPGVKISIGNDTYFVKKDFTRCKVYCDSREILIGSYS